jgi:hypothetical protein
VAAVALATSPRARKLRVGLFAESALQPRWVLEAFAKVAASEFAEIVVIATAEAPPPATPWRWKLYSALDRTAFGVASDPGAGLDLALYVPHQGPALHAKVGSDPDYFLGLELDVAFALGEFDDTWLDGLSRYGVWRFRVDGLREVAAGEPLTGSAVTVRLAAGAEPRLAYRSWSRTYPLSVARNRSQLLAKTAEFAARALREAHRSGHGWLEQCAPAREQPRAQEHRAVAPILGRILRRTVEKALAVEQWSLAFRFRNGEGDVRALPPDLAGFTRIVPPKDRDWADPFALERNGRYYVFFEELVRGSGKGHIAMIEIEADGRWSAPARVLERDYHLSHPFLLEHEGHLYMVPETARNRSVEMYRCVEFPLCWRLEKVLLGDVRLVDATLHRAAERWWMFANGAAGESRVFDDELHLFHAPRLLGDWQPHRRNPVKSDARCSRPAGGLYWRNGALYRPAQICVPRYGAGLSINRVLRLTPQEYAERQVERILPQAQAGILGVHTVNRAGELTVVDAFTRRSRFA